MNSPILTKISTKDDFEQIYIPLEKYLGNKPDHINNKACTFYFIRHGQSTANANNQNAGATFDVDLTPLGVEQAKSTGEFLAERISDFSAVYCSNLTRTHQTQKAINETWTKVKNFSLPKAIPLSEFNEKSYGSLEVTYKPKNADEAKEIEDAKAKKKSDKSREKLFHERYEYKVINNQDSIKDVYTRVIRVLNEIAPNHLGKNVLVITHYALMRAMMESNAAFSAKRDLDSHQISISNTGILVLEHDGEQCYPKAIKDIRFKQS